jgi:hypothetical protein
MRKRPTATEPTGTRRSMLRCLLAVWIGAAAQAEVTGPPPALIDKTLVAWVYPANLTQRGGAALTLMQDESFDSITLGERVPGRWMAGSDFFRRTQDEAGQSACPAETAGPAAAVPVAIVYQGNEVRIYRNGNTYSSYRIAKPHPFGDNGAVLLGLRYLGGMGAIGFLGGAIEEARIYDRALDPQAVASLKANVLSGPRPIAQWTFEDGTSRDSMGRFTLSRLVGGARIADGRLHLNGTDAYLVASRPAVQTVFFKARTIANQWDTWLYTHEGRYDLFILAGPGGKWDGIAMATSPDGVHWTEQGVVLSKADGVTWLGTGSTWKSPAFQTDRKFFLNFSEWRGDRQTIFFAESTDLIHWQRLDNRYEFVQDARWYKPNGRWDCIYTIPRPEGGLYGYWTADPKNGPGVGFGRSADGIHWEALEPPAFQAGAPHGEAGAVEQINGRYYLMLGSGGMLTLVADRPEGPFRPARKNLRLLTGHTYFSRFFPTPAGLLVNHHSIARDNAVYFAPLKRAVVDDEGTLRLMWWKGNEELKREPVDLVMPVDDRRGIRLLGNAFDTRAGIVVEGSVQLGKEAHAGRAGLYIERTGGEGTAILMGPDGVTELGPVKADGSGFKAEDRIDRQTPFGPAARFRLLMKYTLLEFYLDDHLIQCYSLPGEPTGRIGLIQPPAQKAFGAVKAWRP